MKLLVKNSGLNNLKASIQYCGECEKSQIHYATANGWSVCHVCGYNPELDQLGEEDLPISPLRPLAQLGSKAA